MKYFFSFFLLIFLCLSCEKESALPVYAHVPDFSFTERSGREVNRSELENQIWVADFIFTRCMGPCPIMSNHMSMLQTAFGYADDIRLVSFTLDPEHDTPDILREYASSFGADSTRWFFLTGDRKAIYDLAMKAMKINAVDATDSSPILHSTYFILVDYQGNIRGYYDSTNVEALTQITLDAEKLRQEKTTARNHL